MLLRHIGVIGKKHSAGGSPDVLPCGVTLGDVSELSQTPLRHRLMAAATRAWFQQRGCELAGWRSCKLSPFRATGSPEADGAGQLLWGLHISKPIRQSDFISQWDRSVPLPHRCFSFNSAGAIKPNQACESGRSQPFEASSTNETNQALMPAASFLNKV